MQLNRKSMILAFSFGVIVFVGCAIVGCVMTVGLGYSPFSVGQIGNILGESAVFAALAAMLGYSWGVVFPPK